ncbi:Protein of unknown function (DUF3040) [Glaciihabitans tibetensis]|uniref:DUF3040 family protein n=1 Tax=Glaciihabitans tibetensis TaxID=1266600 RepID=A0A2T0VEC4_9MICO|nr:DUF3040 domain-containing protein [Glaciihabitans tibetensis]PRY68536.1 Protein of unknown function (DUF3040) [Glaciihabitans tibetensis]
MPLSEQEQRLLEEMERSLYHNDADFVATVAPRRGKPNYTVLVVGILVGVLGIAALVAGVVIHQPLVGILGFAVMFAGVLIAVAPPKNSAPSRPTPGASRPTGSARGTSFMQNMNDRWDKRQDNRDQ